MPMLVFYQQRIGLGITYSSRQLTQPQVVVLQKGTKFAVAPRKIPNLAIICRMKQGFHQVKHEKKAMVQYTRAQVVKILKEAKLPKQNLTIEERKAIQELQQYNDIIIISADKGNCIVVLDRSEYHNKISILLQDLKMYNLIKKNPISYIEKHLNNFIWKLFKCEKISFSMYNCLRSSDSV